MLTEETVEVPGKGFFDITFEFEHPDPGAGILQSRYTIYNVAKEGEIINIENDKSLELEIIEALEKERDLLLKARMFA